MRAHSLVLFVGIAAAVRTVDASTASILSTLPSLPSSPLLVSCLLSVSLFYNNCVARARPCVKLQRLRRLYGDGAHTPRHVCSGRMPPGLSIFCFCVHVRERAVSRVQSFGRSHKRSLRKRIQACRITLLGRDSGQSASGIRLGVTVLLPVTVARKTPFVSDSCCCCRALIGHAQV